MPQITVDYSGRLDDDFDRRGFALALHPLLVDVAGARAEACKTRFVRTEDAVVGHDEGDDDIVHVMIALLAGRSDETKARVTEGALALVRQYVRPAEGRTLHASAEIRDLDASYRK
ncbi:isomerase [Streptomyces alfalfae]|uniref:Isomerase n=1 Tax=Streptomyces alfalfae TaxID=1642299 RepID=A0ABM6H4N0_9ACTN|nr:isomerase [Streptomyces alfalfae]AYA21369.1 isomerase [Streptomyces fradiae]APY91129.1 isomerase [Streptomyces alfalfae]QUI31424.1 isomerase [Streptomyces alfalfae]RXX36556.1 isomerase [Streptomyces alfalfae]RZN07079.1 isomerase [Streptomyces alfalfae]